MSLRGPEHILYPTGHHAVGKTELCDYLVDAYGFQVVETGAMVRQLYADREEAFADHSLGQFVRAVEATEPGYFDKQLSTRIDTLDSRHGRIIVNGMRAITNIDRAKQNYPDATHSIVWMEAPFDALHERYNIREGRELTPVEFKELLDFDMELGLALVKDSADFLIENDSTIDALRTKADVIIQQRLGLTAIASVQPE